MEIKLKFKHWLGLVTGFLIVVLDFVLFFNFSGKIGPSVWYFNPILVLGILFGSIFFIIDVLEETKRQKELEVKFLEFVRSLVENVRSGVSIPQAILYSSKVNYGSLTPYIKKLANQVEWGYPLHDALIIFAKETKNKVIKRSISIVIEAEKSGGDMGSVLEAVTQSVFEIKKIKDERKSNSYTQIVQGYFIYFFFVAIMIVLQVYLIPRLSVIGSEVGQGLGTIGVGSLGGGAPIEFNKIFLATIIVQGLFAGLMSGKFAEGDYKSGIKHALIMAIGGYLIMSTALGIIQPPPAVSLLAIVPSFLQKNDKK